MKPLADWPVEQRRNIIGVFTDIDDTLTTQGRITPDALQALVDLKAAGLHVIPITGRPVGWSEPFAKTWPVDAMVVENGAVALQMVNQQQGQTDRGENICQIGLQTAYLLPKVLSKVYQTDDQTRASNQAKMALIAKQVMTNIPAAVLSHDSSGRETDLAFDYKEFENLAPEVVQQIVAQLQSHGMETSVSSIHIHGCFGRFDKWTGAQWIVRELFKRELAAELDQWVFVGDSGNDQAMFQHFKHSVGVANIKDYAAQMSYLPGYITQASRGAGFAEMVQAVLSSV